MSDPLDPSIDDRWTASLHTRIIDDDNLQAALHRVASAGCELLANAEAASITIIERGRPTTIASTSPAAVAVDDAQYNADDGPCLTAAREELTIVIDDIADDHRWPAFRDAALSHQLHASLSLPMILGGTTRGGLNVYGTDAFGDDDQRVGAAFATQASVVVANAQAYWAAFDATQNLTVALHSRAVIEQAKGVLITRHGYSDADAFDELRRRSQTANRKLRDVAVDIVEDARRDGQS